MPIRSSMTTNDRAPGARRVPPRAAYCRTTELPRLIPLWPHEIADTSPAGRAKIVGKLERALRAERRQGLAGHWSYDLARHTRLLWAYRAEAAAAGLAAAGAARASIAGANPRAAPPSHPVAGRTAEPISRGGCRGPSSWRDPSGRARSSAQPSDSRAADPTFPGIPPGTDCSGSANDASMT